jgi:hypothetical protein
MKNLLVLILFPLLLFGLERVNLIKNHGFEKEDSSWEVYTGFLEYIENDSAKANKHDSERSYSGIFSSSADTRSIHGDPTPPGIVRDSAVVIQGFALTKTLSDLDSLTWAMKVLPHSAGFTYESAIYISMILNAGKTDWIWAVYGYYNPLLTPGGDNVHRKINNIPLTNDTSWINYEKSIHNDWQVNRGLSPDLKLDSFAVSGLGLIQGGWMGQKAYFDDIRLTGYADYDVGVKGILSKDSVWKNTGYTPTARIKNYGRKAADSFLVIAEIKGGSGVVYADTLTWSLTADTEDTVSFKEFMPYSANYTLTITTVMTPDESDEDDAMSKTLYGTGIVEQPIPAGLVFNVSSFASYPQVSYSLPLGEKGTISLYDPAGRRIESPLKVIGSGSVTINSALSSGVYFIKLETGKISITKKAIILR